MTLTIDNYCIKIPRTNNLKPKPTRDIEYKQTNIESYCVATTRENVLRPKGTSRPAEYRQTLLEKSFAQKRDGSSKENAIDLT